MPYQDVAVAVIMDKSRVLIAKRPMHVSCPGLWEFPGGKRGATESIQDTLARECFEELGIKVTASRSLLNIPYEYEEQKVKLHVYLVERYSGVVHGAEEQETRWVNLSDLSDYQFPAANQKIIDYLNSMTEKSSA